ncbi:MAG TPA: SDR family oxidoreductase [Ardenticatenaceae bacterium]|nr:SDR family oxidoreductase [Ardenticatenaceae bacterium]
MKLEGKTALITGADSGIGQAIAITFAREGANVVVHYGSDEQGAQSTAGQARGYGRQTAVLQADLSDPRNAQRLYQEAVARLGPIDILVNNAGTGSQASQALETTLEDFTHVINVDLISPWALTQAAAKDMRQRGGGVILNVTSVHEEIPSKGDVAYAAAKGGLRNLTRTLCVEVAQYGIRVANIAPGLIATPMTEEKIEDPSKLEQAKETIPMGRPGQPQEVANLALFLASDEASYITGSSFFVDGGLMQSNTGA